MNYYMLSFVPNTLKGAFSGVTLMLLALLVLALVYALEGSSSLLNGNIDLRRQYFGTCRHMRIISRVLGQELNECYIECIANCGEVLVCPWNKTWFQDFLRYNCLEYIVLCIDGGFPISPLCPHGPLCLGAVVVTECRICPPTLQYPAPKPTCTRPWGPIDDDNRLEVLFETAYIAGVEEENYRASLEWVNITTRELNAIASLAHMPQARETDLEPAVLELPNGSRRPEITLGELYDIVVVSGHGGGLNIIWSKPSREQSVNPLLKRIVENATLVTPIYWGTGVTTLYMPGRPEESTYWGYGDTEWVILNSCNSLNLSTLWFPQQETLERIAERVFFGRVLYKENRRIFPRVHPANLYLHGILGWTSKCYWPICGDIIKHFIKQIARNNSIGWSWLFALKYAIGNVSILPIDLANKVLTVSMIRPVITYYSAIGEYGVYDYSFETINSTYPDPADIYYEKCMKELNITIDIEYREYYCRINITVPNIPAPSILFSSSREVVCQPGQSIKITLWRG